MRSCLKYLVFLFFMAVLPSCGKAGQVEIVTKAGEKHVFTVEIADTPETVMDGLMYRTEMAADAGMLFVFPDTDIRRFWMKNTLIPLDMLFITGEGVIAHIHSNAVPKDMTTISSLVPVSRVLEINGGTAEKLKIAPGDRVRGEPWFSGKLAE